MFEDIRERIAQREKLLFTVLPLIPVLVILVNSATLKSYFVAIPALVIYLFVNGEILGRAFFEDEGAFLRLSFGLFVFIAVMALMGVLAIVVLQHEAWYWLGMFFAATTTSFLNLSLVRYNKPFEKASARLRPFFERSYLKVIYISYLVPFVLCFLILLSERSGAVLAQPSMWAVMPPLFLRLYFIATAILVGIVLLPGKVNVKLLLIVLHSIFSLLFLPIILYPGIYYGDEWYDLGRARVVLPVVRLSLESSTLRALNSLVKGFSVHVLTPTFAGALNIDMYWIYVLLVPMLWGFFVPLTSYRLAKMIGAGKRTSIFAALFTIPNYYFLAWGKLTMSDSLGLLFIFLLLYLLSRFLSSYKTRILLPIFITLAVTAVTHFLAVVMSVSFVVLAFALKRFERIRLKFSNGAYFFLLLSFLLSVFLLPLAIIGRGAALPALGESYFSLDKILNTSIWKIVLGIPEELVAKQALLYEMIFPVLGLIGLVYASQRKEKFNATLCLFFFLIFGVSLIDHRILGVALVGGLFGSGRMNFFRDAVALPFVALVIGSAAKSLFVTATKARSFFRWKNIAVGALVCIGLSSWVTLMVYDTYEYYTWGLMGTSLEVEAVKYIDDHSEDRYVAFAPGSTELVAWGFIGYPFPQGKQYVGVSAVPSLTELYTQMRAADADIAYFIAPLYRLPAKDVDKILNQASRIFGLFKVLSNDLGEVYIFRHDLPPLPRSSDVTAFHWATPPTYYVQNDLMRIIVNPATESFDVRDFWGNLYESIELNNTLIDGTPAGKITAVEYFDDVSNTWVEWIPDLKISPADQFQFKLRLENDSLVGLVEKGESSVQLRWESGKAFTLSLEMGAFKRLYIPGLVGGKNSYDVNSREYGFLYTRSLTNNVVLYPAYSTAVSTSYLTYDQISRYCGFELTETNLSYDLYVHNNASGDQWAYIEIWLPDNVYTGRYPPLYYSTDAGQTWVYAVYSAEVEAALPIRTIGGADVNWIFTLPRTVARLVYGVEEPLDWQYFRAASGDSPRLPENFTESGGAQNRMIFGLYLPAGDKALVRLGSSVLKPPPLQTTYQFTDSDNIAYGIRNIKEGLIKLYTSGLSEYVGGLISTNTPSSLAITQNDNDIITSVMVTIPTNTTFFLYSAKDVDTTLDANEDGIPDLI